jgi:glycosyltransferase involved in cell wall biosynthesis
MDLPVMRVSLIVCTRDRAARLPPFLSCIAALESPPGGWELVLVDNASRDETRSILDRFGKDAAFPVQCVHAALPGLSRARNSGLACARGQILAFTDDDCYPRPDYLRALVEVFDEGDCGFVGGRVVLHDPGDAPVGVTDVDQAIDIRPHSFVSPSLIQGANMAFAREVVRAIGEFDPLLGAGTSCVAGEDIEYVARAVWAGSLGTMPTNRAAGTITGQEPTT